MKTTSTRYGVKQDLTRVSAPVERALWIELGSRRSLIARTGEGE